MIPAWLPSFAVVTTAGVAGVWDARTGLIPYPISAVAVLGAVAAMAFGHLPWVGLLWGVGTWGALEGATALRWDRFGAGDTTLLGVLGCWLGPWILPLLAVSALVNLARATLWWGRGRGWPTSLRLGPSIAGASVILTAGLWGLTRLG
jgi:prepilin signal peptidase PulO-like enzyme (type II secretory pathway)